MTQDVDHEAEAARDEEISGAAADAAEARALVDADEGIPVTEWRASSGVLLGFNAVAPYLMQDAASRVPRPEPPIVTVTVANETRTEPNPNDPRYIAALDSWDRESLEAGIRVALIIGSYVKEMPDGFAGPDDLEWSDTIAAAAQGSQADGVWDGPPIGEVGTKRRYLDWLRYWALPMREDLIAVSRICTSIGTLTEEELNTAVASFRRTARAISNLGVVVAQSIIDRSDVNLDEGDGE